MVLVAVGTREGTGAFLYGPTTPVHLSPLAVQGRRELGSLTNCSCSDLRQHCKGRKESPLHRVTLGLTCFVSRLLVWG